MRTINWLKAKKDRSKQQRQEKLALERSMNTSPVQPLGADLTGVVPPETRFTEEYKQFLQEQQAAVESGAAVREEN